MTSDRTTAAAGPDAGSATGDEALRREARVFGAYLLGAPPTEAMIDRYARACGLRLAVPPPAPDLAEVAFVRRHPRSLPPLDAAAALRAPHGLLRTKLTLMLAVVEADPAFAEDFLPREMSRLRAFAALARVALTWPLLLVFGLGLRLVARRAR